MIEKPKAAQKQQRDLGPLFQALRHIADTEHGKTLLRYLREDAYRPVFDVDHSVMSFQEGKREYAAALLNLMLGAQMDKETQND